MKRHPFWARRRRYRNAPPALQAELRAQDRPGPGRDATVDASGRLRMRVLSSAVLECCCLDHPARNSGCVSVALEVPVSRGCCAVRALFLRQELPRLVLRQVVAFGSQFDDSVHKSHTSRLPVADRRLPASHADFAAVTPVRTAFCLKHRKWNINAEGPGPGLARLAVAERQNTGVTWASLSVRFTTSQGWCLHQPQCRSYQTLTGTSVRYRCNDHAEAG